jgi:nitronate monooxygenase
VGDYLKKGGTLKETEGRKCFCNGLLATVGLEQARSNGQLELPIVTAGDDIAQLARFLAPGKDTYTAADVLKNLLGPCSADRAGATPIAEPVNAAMIEVCRD